MRTRSTITGLLAALLGLALLLGGGAGASLKPRPPVPAAAAASVAEHKESEKEIPAGVPLRHGPHAVGRPAPGGGSALRPLATVVAPAAAADLSAGRPRAPGAPLPYPSRPTGGATASVYQVFRC
ncbi:hypothetical protein [Kitasatospora sp. NPDC051914]|uniref:hypothetical protein n=1 Tax=Kitasatospora sp. NPDC051914 TaxID=3154945 RepID=UPI00343EBF40